MRNDIENTPSDWQIENLRRLCTLVLQPIRDQLAVPVIVLSGFRSARVNQLVGGSRLSDHMSGSAADIVAVGYNAAQLAKAIVIGTLPVKQLILEFGSWVHISIAPEHQEPRRELLVASRVNGQTVYTPGLA